MQREKQAQVQGYRVQRQVQAREAWGARREEEERAARLKQVTDSALMLTAAARSAAADSGQLEF